MLASDLTPMLTLILQASFKKDTRDSPTGGLEENSGFKRGNKSSAIDWLCRPICLTSIICKLSEHIISSSIAI